MISLSKGTFKISDFKTSSPQEVEEFIKRITKEKPGLSVGGLMGLVMEKYRGKVDGKTISELVKKHAK
jgi:Glu-tRNA(Gln) amidotransferase subunit E-like FAD-binding protein